MTGRRENIVAGWLFGQGDWDSSKPGSPKFKCWSAIQVRKYILKFIIKNKISPKDFFVKFRIGLARSNHIWSQTMTRSLSRD